MGSLTLRIMSASAQTWSWSSAILAPVATNSSTVLEEPTPAPAWTTNSSPCRVNSFTADGVIATRYSWFLTSLGTPTFMRLTILVGDPAGGGPDSGGCDGLRPGHDGEPGRREPDGDLPPDRLGTVDRHGPGPQRTRPLQVAAPDQNQVPQSSGHAAGHLVPGVEVTDVDRLRRHHQP